MKTIAEIFGRIHRENTWGSAESRSGPGSTKARAADFSGDVIALLKELNTQTLLDAGCGDFGWADSLADVVPNYVGVDVVPDLINRHQREHAAPGRQFLCLDLAEGDLPRADVILSRDCLVHLSFEDIHRTILNFERSGSTYLLTTTFVERAGNEDIATGDWRPLNFQAEPFNWPAPRALVDERCTHTNGIYRDKRLGLWNLTDLRPYL